MNNNNVLEEFFVWEEKNLIDQNQNLLKNAEQDNSVTTIETKIDSTLKDWKDITNPKLRKKIRNKAYYEKNKEEILKRIKVTGKVYRENNKDKIKLYCINNKEKEKIRFDKWRQKNKEQIRTKNYRKENKVKLSEKNRKREKEKIKNDINYKLKSLLRHRLYLALKGNFKSGSAVRDLGCTIPVLKTYLESKFQSGMSWDNWTADGWHIDHIKPLSSFDLTDRNQLLEACNYTNLQPLWAKDNLSKGAKTV